MGEPPNIREMQKLVEDFNAGAPVRGVEPEALK